MKWYYFTIWLKTENFVTIFPTPKRNSNQMKKKKKKKMDIILLCGNFILVSIFLYLLVLDVIVIKEKALLFIICINISFILFLLYFT